MLIIGQKARFDRTDKVFESRYTDLDKTVAGNRPQTTIDMTGRAAPDDTAVDAARRQSGRA